MSNESSTTKAVEWVILVILIIMGVALVPTVVDTVQTGMNSITGEAVKIDSAARVLNSSGSIYGTHWEAISFNMTTNCNLSNITLGMSKTNTTARTTTGDVTVYLEDADPTTGQPNGTILGTSTFPSTSLNSSDSSVLYDNITFSFTGTIPMVSGYNYSIVVKAASCNATEHVNWEQQGSSATPTIYLDQVSTDGGGTWTQRTIVIDQFSLYGVYNLVGINVAAVLMGLIPFMFIVGLIIYFLVRLLRS